jgi:hypothetical protein
VHEQDVLDQAELLEQHRAHQPVEVTPGDQPISLRAQGAASSSVGQSPTSLRSATWAEAMIDEATSAVSSVVLNGRLASCRANP